MMTNFNLSSNTESPAFLYDIPEWLCTVMCSGADIDDILDMKLGDGLDVIEEKEERGKNLGDINKNKDEGNNNNNISNTNHNS